VGNYFEKVDAITHTYYYHAGKRIAMRQGSALYWPRSVSPSLWRGEPAVGRATPASAPQAVSPPVRGLRPLRPFASRRRRADGRRARSRGPNAVQMSKLGVPGSAAERGGGWPGKPGARQRRRRYQQYRGEQVVVLARSRDVLPV